MMNIIPKDEFMAKRAIETGRVAQNVAQDILEHFAREQVTSPLQTCWKFRREVSEVVALEVDKVLEATLLPLGWNVSWYNSDQHILFEID